MSRSSSVLRLYRMCDIDVYGMSDCDRIVRCVVLFCLGAAVAQYSVRLHFNYFITVDRVCYVIFLLPVDIAGIGCFANTGIPR